MENFEELLEQYMDMDEIEEKKKNDDEEYEEEIEEQKKNTDSKTLKTLKGYAITIKEFLRDYIKMDITNIETDNLTHKNLKDLTRDNPFVIGISNDYVDIDEIIKRDYLVVIDCFGNVGSYLNPEYLRDITRLEYVEREFEIVEKSRVIAFEKLMDYYNRYMSVLSEYTYLEAKCSGYYEMLNKANKNNVVKNIKKYIDQFGVDLLDTDDQSLKIEDIVSEEKKYGKHKGK